MKPEDRWAIEALLNTAALSLDERDLETMENCFAKDVQLMIRIRSSGVEEPMDGRDALMALVRDRLAEQQDRRRHVLSNLTVTPDGPGRARAVSYLTLIAVQDGNADLISTGCYRDLVECRHGQWVIAERDIELDLPY